MLAALLLAVMAQDPQQEQRDTTRLKPITVRERPAHRYTATTSNSSTKVDVPLRDTPQSVSVLTSAALAEQSVQSLAEAMRYVPGVTFGQGEGHRDAPTIRGNSSTADFFVDGMRDDAQYFRDFYNMERVEALRGPNAMIFGRAGGGGVINRVTKRAQWTPTRELTLEGGTFGHGRGTLDFGGAASDRAAVRLNGLYQHSNGFRDAFSLSRLGVSPAATLRAGARTELRVSGEFFEDDRRVDRGHPSFQGRPADVPTTVFFGNPDASFSEAKVWGGAATLEHRRSDRLRFSSTLRGTTYDKYYQNVLPGAINAAGTDVALSGYASGMDRTNVFGQAEAVAQFAGRVTQNLLVGVEAGRQSTDNIRLTGYFNGTATSLTVPLASPTVATPIEFRPSASDPENHVVADVASLYLQDHVDFGRLQATIGARVERFDLRLYDRRSGNEFARLDNMVSPRAGIVWRAALPLSVYASYGVSHLPSAGDQFAGLTPTTETLKPERFDNQEIGVKFERAALSATIAAYRLERSNSAAPSALDPGVLVQTGRQESEGVEMTVAGQPLRGWDVIAAVASQRATIASRTTSATAGATVPLVPRRTASLWNRYQLSRVLGVGAGVVSQSRMYAAIDNTVTLPGFTRADAAVYFTGLQNMKLQLNVENLFDEAYSATSHGNNNIMPGAPRTVRVSMTTTVR
jgi:catecholate siderophore receptor